jgi:TetR/AcrR family transcriptional regulator, tetracycline repressor protein
MTRLAANRDTHLTPAEIATEALGQFDAGAAEPSIRSLAAALRVAPSAIYHHYGSRAAIVQAAVELVWAESATEFLRLVPQPYETEAEEALVAAGIATRRAWLAHYRLAPYMAATPQASEPITNALTLLASLFERLGLEGEHAATAFHTYSSFMIGAVLFAAARRGANEELGERSENGGYGRFDEVMLVSVADPARDEELFAEGLRRLIEGVRQPS